MVNIIDDEIQSIIYKIPRLRVVIRKEQVILICRIMFYTDAYLFYQRRTTN
jgi:hypothetical protein